MKCPICHNETNASAPYCEFCGAELNREFDFVAEEFVRETEEEKIRKIEEEIRNFLVLALFFFLVALTIYTVTPEPPKVQFSPAYFAPLEQKKETSPKQKYQFKVFVEKLEK